ncbi:MAG: hypothetical protein CFE34_03910 [Rhodobacteraceae bacterium PARR1]|nr:MAG: hypothetical protein CFE34_03910 [Rhodobacteraceae bacterium PARR1]
MSILVALKEALDRAPNTDTHSLQGALADAEKLADLFSEVRPQAYVVPIEKYVGLPVLGEARLASNGLPRS